MTYIPTIGLEIHAELKTRSKMFCACTNDPDEETPNMNVCPICMGHPGTLPVLNKEAIKHVLKIGLAVNGDVADFTEWDRKNYFYPDIPKGYQISQYKYPLISNGTLAGVDLERIHLEEDTAQSTHDTHKMSLVNFNRSGVPLMELVTKPVIHDADTATNFAKELQLLLRTLGIAEANMEKGEMRVEANISVATESDTKNKKFGTKTEVKNLNSFRSVGNAIEYEIDRQIKILDSGKKVVQETRGWDDEKEETYSQRSKESSHDYRYFPDPDIPKVRISEISDFKKENLLREIPELPEMKRERLRTSLSLTDKEVAMLVDSHSLLSYLDSVLKVTKDDKAIRKLVVNYILSDFMGMLKKEKIPLENIGATISPANFSEMIVMLASGSISSRGAKDLLPLMMQSPDTSPSELATKHSLIQQNDSGQIAPIIDKIIQDNPKAVSEYKAGKSASLQFLIGQAMRATKGSANPEMLRTLFSDKLMS